MSQRVLARALNYMISPCCLYWALSNLHLLKIIFCNLSFLPSLPCLFPSPILFSRMDLETIGASMGDTRIVWLSIHTLLLLETIWSMRWLFCTQTHFSTNQATGSLRWVDNYFCQRDENGKPCCTSSSITREGEKVRQGNFRTTASTAGEGSVWEEKNYPEFFSSDIFSSP